VRILPSYHLKLWTFLYGTGLGPLSLVHLKGLGHRLLAYWVSGA